MLNWIEKIDGKNKTCHIKIGQLEIVCISYTHHPISFQVLIDDLYTLYFKDFESLEECKEKAEQWLKHFFSPIVETARNYFLNTLESEWSVEEVLKCYNNDQQERHTGSSIGRTDIREVLEGEVKRKEEV